MQKQNISTDRAQGIDEKNGFNSLIMFTPRVMVIKMSKMAQISSNKSVPVLAKYLGIMK